MEDGNDAVAANGTGKGTATEAWPQPHQWGHFRSHLCARWGQKEEATTVFSGQSTQLALSKKVVKKILAGVDKINGTLVWWPPFMSKGHPCTVDRYNNRYRLCSTCEGWFVHKIRWCGGCKRAIYCSHDCQTIGWKEHKYECAHYIGDRVNIATCALAAIRSIRQTEIILENEATLAKWFAEKTKQEANCICTRCRGKYKDPCKHLLLKLCWECRSERLSELARCEREIQHMLGLPLSSSPGAASSSS